MAAQEQEVSGCNSGTCLACMLCCVFLPAAITAIATLIVLSCMSKDPVYSVTITGVAGLDVDDAAAAANLSSLSPVFNLTVRVDNAGCRLSDAACIERLWTAAVSYGDAVLGRGSLPRFCAKDGKVRERGARAWGQHVDLPRFLRDQLAGELAAGEAAFDVKMTTPAMNHIGGVVCSQAKIGGGPAPCRTEKVYHQEQANPGSTG